MDWIDLCKKRKQTFVFKEIVPEKNLIDKIILDLHTNCPSKQKKVPYNIEILDWSDKQRRIDIFSKTYCDKNTLQDRRNPQTLAPYLILFSKRQQDVWVDYNLEIGLAAMFFVFSAANLGLDTGFCGCYNDPNYELALGVGYAAADRSLYYNPLLNKFVNGPGVPFDEHKPELHEYVNVQL
jgi:hypothetical protein